ncbi:MAG: CBS domain-containing protein, partial [Actinobacteria bacterium]|nr:CBS domain-containing protein [Actinomycetota bacterium]
DTRFTLELARFNLEANLAPLPLAGGTFSDLEGELRDVIGTAAARARAFDAHVLLTGILPTLRPEDLDSHNMSPEPRYALLNEAIFRGRHSLAMRIDGIESFQGAHTSVVIEGANTSFQVHLQVDPADSGPLYNLAQLLAAPLVAAAANSPVLLGRRLWHETRIAVFERALDARSEAAVVRGAPTRVTFGDAWVRRSAVEVFHDNLARFPVLLVRDVSGDGPARPDDAAPRLDALQLHNGTVWRWNRPCYGVSRGRPHLRIECRVLPAGPTVIDEVANAALFCGLMLGLADLAPTIPSRLSFSDATENFLAAAQHGPEATLTWLDARRVPARTLLLDELLPAARAGLACAGTADADVERYLGVIEARVRTGRTGSAWLLSTQAANRGEPPAAVWHRAVQTMLARQFGARPVHEWPDDEVVETGAVPDPTVGQIMTRQLFTVSPDDVLDLAARVMEWKHVRHIPVEGADGALVGLVTARGLLRLQGQDRRPAGTGAAVQDVMHTDITTVPPGLSLRDAMRRMESAPHACLLVVDDGRLVGIVTDRDLVVAAASLL